MCLCVVVVSLFRLCHITRVYVGFFILTCYIHCVSVLSMPSECCVCAVVCGLIWFFPSNVFIRVAPYPHRPPPWQTKSTHCNLERLCLQKYLPCCISPVIHVHVLLHRSNWQARQPLIEILLCKNKFWAERRACLHVHVLYILFNQLASLRGFKHWVRCCAMAISPRPKVTGVSGAVRVKG